MVAQSIFLAFAFTACAGTVGEPESVRKILEARYLGESSDLVLADLGPTTNQQAMRNGNVLFTWIKQTSKYATNVAIKSDEFCRISMIVGPNGAIQNIGKVDDSLGGWRISYCKEQYDL